MAQIGSIVARVTTSRAQLPVTGATVIITTPSEEGRPRVLAVLETDANGLAGPIQLPAPTTPSNGTTPGGPPPFSTYSLWVEHPAYEIASVESFQVFPNILSVQDITLVPLSGRPGNTGTSREPITAPPQPL